MSLFLSEARIKERLETTSRTIMNNTFDTQTSSVFERSLCNLNTVHSYARFWMRISMSTRYLLKYLFLSQRKTTYSILPATQKNSHLDYRFLPTLSILLITTIIISFDFVSIVVICISEQFDIRSTQSWFWMPVQPPEFQMTQQKNERVLHPKYSQHPSLRLMRQYTTEVVCRQLLKRCLSVDQIRWGLLIKRICSSGRDLLQRNWHLMWLRWYSRYCHFSRDYIELERVILSLGMKLSNFSTSLGYSSNLFSFGKFGSHYLKREFYFDVWTPNLFMKLRFWWK